MEDLDMRTPKLGQMMDREAARMMGRHRETIRQLPIVVVRNPVEGTDHQSHCTENGFALPKQVSLGVCRDACLNVGWFAQPLLSFDSAQQERWILDQMQFGISWNQSLQIAQNLFHSSRIQEQRVLLDKIVQDVNFQQSLCLDSRHSVSFLITLVMGVYLLRLCQDRWHTLQQ